MYNIKLMLSVPMSYWEQSALIKNIAKGKTSQYIPQRQRYSSTPQSLKITDVTG
jgi:hypothetical protein